MRKAAEDAIAALIDEIAAANLPWSAILRAGQQLQIIDLHGNQAVDTLFWGVRGETPDPALRYSAQATVAAQRNIFLTTGSVLRAADGTPLVTIVADEVGNHDTIAGACSKESNTLRYGHHTVHQHACAENFLAEATRWGMGKRDIVSNVNFFMNVPVDADGTLRTRIAATYPLERYREAVTHAARGGAERRVAADACSRRVA